MKGINKTIAVLMVTLMASQTLISWPACGAWRSEIEVSLTVVAPLPRAVGVLPDTAEDDDFGETVHRCRNPGVCDDTEEADFKVNMGYRIRDQTSA